MKLVEIFDKQFKIKWEKNEGVTKAFIDIFGNNVIVIFTESFFEDDSNEDDPLLTNRCRIVFFVNGKIDQTNINKDQFLIFSAVYQAIKQMVYKDNYDEIVFEAEGSSRIKLYKTFIDRYASKLGYKLKSDRKLMNNTIFMLEKI